MITVKLTEEEHDLILEALYLYSDEGDDPAPDAKMAYELYRRMVEEVVRA